MGRNHASRRHRRTDCQTVLSRCKECCVKGTVKKVAGAKDQHRGHLLNCLPDMEYKNVKKKSRHNPKQTIWVIGINERGYKNRNCANSRNPQNPVLPHRKKGTNHAQKNTYISISQQVTADFHKTNLNKSPQYSASCSINCLRLGWLIGIVSPVTSVISSFLTPFTKKNSRCNWYGSAQIHAVPAPATIPSYSCSR